eukprot:gnl/MRDRNA2_/MRDRNA2_34612_c0_seq1.p1 gnl/MRDRNA2_/MRDRNA2_34612_c0~~gnl/MRDRNA2_/MRDRNA2_34612_c0_seq1.p1  ORF type:complete len:428 (-),score=49.09 gnl/MRDRNA2_/MRDRNA2_34612_c0_seq1:91-1374(-)
MTDSHHHHKSDKPPVSGWVKSWVIAVAMLVCYLLFIPCVLFCSYNLYLFAGMCCLCVIVLLLECLVLVEKLQRKESSKAGIITHMLLEMCDILKIMSSTLVPILMLTLGGGSFAFLVKLSPHIQDCGVTSLGQLSNSGYMTFECNDGYIATDLQQNIDAWNGTIVGRRLLPERKLRMMHHAAHVVHHAHHAAGVPYGLAPQKGYAAPVFTSRAAWESGAAPVAWAVRAGRPIMAKYCGRINATNRKACGVFASSLRRLWMQFPPPASHLHFGEAWGYNITMFDPAHMRQAALAVQQKFPRDNWGPTPGSASVPFVIPESVEEYTGAAITILWVSAALLLMGTIDRCAQFAESRRAKDVHPLSSPRVAAYYSQLGHLQANAIDVEEDRDLTTEMKSMWNDPLNAPVDGPEVGQMQSMGGPRTLALSPR